MKITENINLGGLIFTIDEDALLKLQNYLNSIERHYSDKIEREEIVNDIETRIAELFQTELCKNKEVVTSFDVDKAIEILGLPQDFETGSNRKTNYQQRSGNSSFKRLFRNPDKAVLGGVCNGFGYYFNIDPVIVRVLFVVLGFFAGGVLIYLILWVVLPAASSPNDKLEMKGTNRY